MKTSIMATVRVHGVHCWGLAPQSVAYLRMPHRHEFVIRACVRVYHTDRDVEFHTLQEYIKQDIASTWLCTNTPWQYDFATASCEKIAETIGKLLGARNLTVVYVEVWEDDENGARVTFQGGV